MRNYILSFLFLCIPCLTNAQEIQDEEYIVFADDNVKFICVKNWDTNGDGELSYSEAAAVTDIGTVFRWRNIYFFYELQYFTGLTSIGNEAFLGCSDLYSIQIPNSVSSIEDGAFQDCYGLTSIVIPNSVTSIGDEAFSGCSGLKSVISYITDVFETGSEAFGGIPADATLYVPEGMADTYRATADWNSFSNIVEFYKDAPEDCIKFADAYVKATCVENWDTNHDGELSYSEAAAVTDIGTVFIWSGITSFDELQYFIGLTSIGNGAFFRCSGLTSIEIPNSVTSIGNEAFWGCSLTSIEIPNSVTSIGNSAFRDCSALTSIEIPNSVTSIGSSAFEGCSGLASFVIPNSVTSIGTLTFSGCSGLTDIVIPNSVTSIGTAAFQGCSNLTDIVIPNSVTSIGTAAFIECNNLWDIYCYAETVPSMEYINHYGDASSMEPSPSYRYDATLHVPACAIDDYKNTEPWSSCFSDIVPIDPMEFDLTVSDAGIATLYLDFSAAIPNVEGLGDVMYVSDVVGRSLILTKVENNIPAHTGVIVYAQPGTYTFTSSTTHVDACANSRLSGVTEDTPTADIDGTVYTLSVGKNPEDIGFRKFVGETLAANKAFLVMNKSSEVNFYNFSFDDELTGISTTEQNVDAESAVIYDLQGRRVTSPSKGIYIVNGKKRFINNR